MRMTLDLTPRHPLKQLLHDQGRSVAWCAEQLGLRPTSLHDRLAGRRPGGGKRGPKRQPVEPAHIRALALALGITPETLADWLGEPVKEQL